MSDLDKLPNLGKIAVQRLSVVGINTSEDLKSIGSKEAFNRLYMHEGDTCFNTLCALEGAIEGIRWHNLSDTKKQELKNYFKAVKS
jgi:DNA transformation protein